MRSAENSDSAKIKKTKTELDKEKHGGGLDFPTHIGQWLNTDSCNTLIIGSPVAQVRPRSE